MVCGGFSLQFRPFSVLLHYEKVRSGQRRPLCYEHDYTLWQNDIILLLQRAVRLRTYRPRSTSPKQQLPQKRVQSGRFSPILLCVMGWDFSCFGRLWL